MFQWWFFYREFVLYFLFSDSFPPNKIQVHRDTFSHVKIQRIIPSVMSLKPQRKYLSERVKITQTNLQTTFSFALVNCCLLIKQGGNIVLFCLENKQCHLMHEKEIFHFPRTNTIEQQFSRGRQIKCFLQCLYKFYIIKLY